MLTSSSAVVLALMVFGLIYCLAGHISLDILAIFRQVLAQ